MAREKPEIWRCDHHYPIVVEKVGAVSGGGAVTKGPSRRPTGIRSWAALVPLLAHLETVGPRHWLCEAHYGTRSNVSCGRYRPRYGPSWWW